MNVGQLKKMLKWVKDDTEIVLSCDEEGNRFNYLVDAEPGLFNEQAHEVYNLDEEELDLPIKEVLVLWP